MKAPRGAHLDTATNAEQTRCERSAAFTPLQLANVARLPMNSNIQPNHTLKRRERRVPRCGWECQDAPYPAPHRVTCHLSPVTFPIQTTRDWPWPDDTSPIIHALCFSARMNSKTAPAFSLATMATIPMPILKT